MCVRMLQRKSCLVAQHGISIGAIAIGGIVCFIRPLLRNCPDFNSMDVTVHTHTLYCVACMTASHLTLCCVHTLHQPFPLSHLPSLTT